jgi:hypothetical protein
MQVQQLAEAYFGHWNPSGYAPLPSGRQLMAKSRSEVLPRASENNMSSHQSTCSASSEPGAPLRSVLCTEVSEAGPLCLLGFYRPSLNGIDGVPYQV